MAHEMARIGGCGGRQSDRVRGARTRRRRPGGGRKMPLEHCARGHVIGDFNPFGGIGSTPSFQLLAKRSDWLERFQTS